MLTILIYREHTLIIIDTGIKDTKKKDKMIDDFEIREEPKKENRDREGIETDIIVPQDNLAGKIFAMMEKDPPRKSEDPKYISIAKEIAEHAAGEKSAGEFKYTEMLGKKGEQYKHGHGCYKDLFYGSLEKSAVETGKEYREKVPAPKRSL